MSNGYFTSYINLTTLFNTTIDFAAWADLISFRPSHEVQRSLMDHIPDWFVHKLESALGPINLDYYPVKIISLPVIEGQTTTAEQFLSHIRLNLNNFVDTKYSRFSPYDSIEEQKWNSLNPLTAVIHIDMEPIISTVSTDEGSVVVSEFTSQNWTFSTIWTLGDFAHPVSGNRQFGFTVNDDGSYTFYTRGADRTTNIISHKASTIVFGAAHQLWLSLQKGIANFVKEHNGAAEAEPAISSREDWEDIKKKYHRPSVSWLE